MGTLSGFSCVPSGILTVTPATINDCFYLRYHKCFRYIFVSNPNTITIGFVKQLIATAIFLDKLFCSWIAFNQSLVFRLRKYQILSINWIAPHSHFWESEKALRDRIDRDKTPSNQVWTDFIGF